MFTNAVVESKVTTITQDRTSEVLKLEPQIGRVKYDKLKTSDKFIKIFCVALGSRIAQKCL